MGRKRITDKHLPHRMRRKGAAFYHVAKGHWTPLGSDYGEALAEWSKLEGATHRPVLTVADALAAYLVDRAKTLSDKTLTGYKAQAATLGKVFGAMRLSDVKREHVFTYLRKRGNVAGNRERDLLRAAFNHALNLGYEGKNPCLKMQARNREAPRERYVTDAELAALIAACGLRLARLVQWLYLTGMRIGDAIAFPLTGADTDGIRWREGKTGKPRFIEWSPELLALWKAAQGSRIGAQPVFLGQRGPYTLSGLESTWARVRERAGILDVRLHDLRAKASSDVSLAHAQALLGHSNSETTTKHYRRRVEGVKPVR
jgi:integrase